MPVSPPDQLQTPPKPALVTALDRLSPFWAPQLLVGCALLLDVALPSRLTVGPSWLLPSVEGALLAVLVVISPLQSIRHSQLRRKLAMGLIGLVSAVNVFSLVELAHFLLHSNVENGRALIYSGAVLWATNVLLFALWYWELDRGGPTARRLHDQSMPDFLFPQMSERRWAPENWMPGLTDYLYTSFTNATAFSPTDTMPLTVTAKWLMGAQALVSLITIGLVVARAVNILA